jgi:peptidyl-prolyl cis-trans isomerase SurA
MTNFKSLVVFFSLCLWLVGSSTFAQISIKKRMPAPSKTTTAPKSEPVANAAPAPSTAINLATTPLIPTNVIREVDYIVALVNSEPITRNEVLVRQRRLLAQWAAQGISAPVEADPFKRVLEQLIEERAMQQVAKEYGVRVGEAQLDDALLNIARQNQLPNLVQMRAKYEAEGGNWNGYREEIRGELTRVQLREREVDARVLVTDTEIDQALQQQSMTSKGGQDINLAQILVALPDNPTANELAKAQQKATQIAKEASAAGTDFLKLAQQTSDAADKAKGGVMGLRSVDRYPSLFVDATKNLRVGNISAIVRSDAGFHILKLLERQASSTASVVQSRVRHILLPLTDKLNEEQAKAELRTYKAQIESGRTSFSVVAREHSVDGSAAQGGDLGWTTPGLFVPEFERVMNALPTGKLSEPFTSRFGVHLLEVVDRKEVAVSVQEQREMIRNQLREKKAAEAYVLWIADIRGRAFVEYKNAAQ